MDRTTRCGQVFPCSQPLYWDRILSFSTLFLYALVKVTSSCAATLAVTFTPYHCSRPLGFSCWSTIVFAVLFGSFLSTSVRFLGLGGLPDSCPQFLGHHHEALNSYSFIPTLFGVAALPAPLILSSVRLLRYFATEAIYLSHI